MWNAIQPKYAVHVKNAMIATYVLPVMVCVNHANHVFRANRVIHHAIHVIAANHVILATVHANYARTVMYVRFVM
jgi:hypothetical protein